jgi:hypothetical protein
MARSHPVAPVVEEAADEEGLGFGPELLVIMHLLVQLGLDGVEQVPIDDGRLLARKRPLKSTSPM